MTKKFLALLSLVAFISLNVISQDLNQTYLDSLPSDIREDVLGKMDAKEELESPVYRSASTFLDKDAVKSSLFGSSFFDTVQSSFMPINEPNLDSSYVLDFGDVLEVQLIGQKDYVNSYAIKRDGSINLPDIGKIILSGLSLGEASSLIKAKINNAYIETEVFVTLKNLRDISILIVGNAYNPGIYTLNGNSNMIHALSMAGGINEIGSYRNISLVRSGKIIKNLDIYDVLINGTYDHTINLRSGDSIVVNPIGNVVSIESGAMNSSEYELLNNEKFDDLLRYANGFSKNADLSQIIVKRIIDGEIMVVNIDAKKISDFELMDNDSIYISEHKFNTVTIEGAIKYPGKYKLVQGSLLSDLIDSAGGYEDTAYPFGGYLENKKALEINITSKNRLYQKFLLNIVNNPNNFQVVDSNIISLIQELKNAEPTGRVIAEFDLDVIARNPALNTILDDGDRVFIPINTQQVYIHGEVNNPGAIRYSPGKGIDYYIDAAGGALLYADAKKIFIVHPNGETIDLSANNNKLSFLLDEEELLIYPGSIIYIPQKPNLRSSVQTAAIWAPILGSLALSLTSLSVLNNQN